MCIYDFVIIRLIFLGLPYQEQWNKTSRMFGTNNLLTTYHSFPQGKFKNALVAVMFSLSAKACEQLKISHGYLAHATHVSMKQNTKLPHSLLDIKVLLLALQHTQSLKMHHFGMKLTATFISSSRSVLIYSWFHPSFVTRTILLLMKWIHSGVYFTESLTSSPPTYSTCNFWGMVSHLES